MNNAPVAAHAALIACYEFLRNLGKLSLPEIVNAEDVNRHVVGKLSGLADAEFRNKPLMLQ